MMDRFMTCILFVEHQELQVGDHLDAADCEHTGRQEHRFRRGRCIGAACDKHCPAHPSARYNSDNIYYVKFIIVSVMSRRVSQGCNLPQIQESLPHPADVRTRKMDIKSILIANGPNLNLLGQRQPEIYGSVQLADICRLCRERAEFCGVELEFIQSNHEGELVDAIQSAIGKHQGIVINPAGYTHTSVAIADALSGTGLPVIEVHLSNIHRREPFRSHSYVSQVAEGVICGLGPSGYLLAIEALAKMSPDRAA